jgi:hypothetical protein
VVVERRGIEHRQQLGTGGLGGLAGRLPGIFADQQAHAHAGQIEDTAAVTGTKWRCSSNTP